MPYWIGSFMSGTPIWASTEPSENSTPEWKIDWGWMTISTWSRRRPNRFMISIISKPLFIRVAQSIVIFRPIFQVGCLRAMSGVTSARSPLYLAKAPPEAVRITRRIVLSGAAARGSGLRPWTHWKIADGSESTGTILAFQR